MASSNPRTVEARGRAAREGPAEEGGGLSPLIAEAMPANDIQAFLDGPPRPALIHLEGSLLATGPERAKLELKAPLRVRPTPEGGPGRPRAKAQGEPVTARKESSSLVWASTTPKTVIWLSWGAGQVK